MTTYTKGILYTLIGGACWGISGTCGQYLCSARGMDTRWLTDVRLLGAGIILLAGVLLKDRRQMIQLVHTPKALLHCIVFGVCGLMLTQYCYLTSISKTNAGTATVLQQLSVIIILIFVCITTKKAPAVRENIAIAFCLIGTFFVATHGSFSELCISKSGLLWGILSACAAALYILIPQDLLKTWGGIIPVGVGMLSGGIAFFFLMRVWTIPVSFAPDTVFVTIIIVTVGTVLAFTLFLKGTSMVGPTRGNMLGCIEPLTATLCSALFMHTVFTAMDIIGFAFILSTVFILTKH